MANSAARIAEIRAALSSTGKSVSDYSARFAAGEAPEQTLAEGEEELITTAGSALREDEVFSVLSELAAVSKDLHGRCAGRNADDVNTVLGGLTRLQATWATTRDKLETKIEQILEKERQGVRKSIQVDLERQMQELQANLAADEASVQEAKQRVATAEKALAQAQATIATLQRESDEKQHALDAALRRAEAAESEKAALKETLAVAEASLLAMHTSGASATVEESATEAPMAATKTVMSLTMTGACVLGSTLRVGGTTGLPNVAFQWYRIAPSGAEELIGGATRQQYAPEPRDVGLTLRCAVTASPGEAPQQVSSPEAVTDMEGLSSTVAGAANLESVEFNCVVVQRNGEMQDRREVHILEVLGDRIKIKRAGKTRYKEAYNEHMQVCGARGGGDAAAQGLFLCLGPTLVFMLALESAKQRNAAIQLIRMRATARGLTVLGPKDKADGVL